MLNVMNCFAFYHNFEFDFFSFNWKFIEFGMKINFLGNAVCCRVNCSLCLCVVLKWNAQKNDAYIFCDTEHRNPKSKHRNETLWWWPEYVLNFVQLHQWWHRRMTRSRRTSISWVVKWCCAWEWGRWGHETACASFMIQYRYTN